ncbi:MAG: flagellar hook-length control protein FliK [Pseudomonadota bacterium]
MNSEANAIRPLAEPAKPQRDATSGIPQSASKAEGGGDVIQGATRAEPSFVDAVLATEEDAGTTGSAVPVPTPLPTVAPTPQALAVDVPQTAGAQVPVPEAQPGAPDPRSLASITQTDPRVPSDPTASAPTTTPIAAENASRSTAASTAALAPAPPRASADQVQVPISQGAVQGTPSATSQAPSLPIASATAEVATAAARPVPIPVATTVPDNAPPHVGSSEVKPQSSAQTPGDARVAPVAPTPTGSNAVPAAPLPYGPAESAQKPAPHGQQNLPMIKGWENIETLAAGVERQAPGAAAPRLGIATPLAATSLPPPDTLIAQIASQVRPGQGAEITIRLDPPELGALRIGLSISDGQVSALVSAERGDVDAMLRRHGDQLSEALSRAGFGAVDLGFASPQGDGEPGTGAHGSGHAPIDVSAEGMGATPGAHVAVDQITLSSGGLDMRL